MTTGGEDGAGSTPEDTTPVPDEARPDSGTGQPLVSQQDLLGHPRVYMRRQVSEAVGVPLTTARRYWHALGFPRVGDDEAIFTDADVASLRRIVSLVREGTLDEDTALDLTRSLARSADRLATWQTQLVWEMLQERRVHQAAADGHDAAGQPDASPAESLVALANRLEPLMTYAWRRHLAAAVAQLEAQNQDEPQGSEHVRTVGFADMVGFTHVVQRLSERQLGRFVQRFEAMASDTIASYGGRLVKTIGDEVFFSCHDPLAAAWIGLTLHESIAEEPDMPPLRIGLATGPVISRLGDVYGTTVNRAARLTSLARPGTVLADIVLARQLARGSSIRLSPLRPRELRGLGPTQAYALRPPKGATLVPPARRA